MNTSPNSTSKTPLSTLSPHVAEFVPRCLALKKGSWPSSESNWSYEKTAKRGTAVDDWSSKVKEVANDKESTVSDSKTHSIQMRKDLSQGTQRDGAGSFSWRQKRFSEGIDSNWRSTSTDTNKRMGKNNEIGLITVKREERKMDFHQVSRNNEHSGLSNFGAKRFPGNESTCRQSRQNQEGRERTSREISGEGLGQRRTVRTGPGIGRGRTAWGNDMRQDNIIGSNDTKCINASDSSKISHCQENKRLGCSHGVWSSSHNLLGSNKATIKNEKPAETSKDKDNKKNESLPREDEWIVVKTKNKIDEKKETEENFAKKKLDKNPKEINESENKSNLLNSNEKLEKKQKRKDLKKEIKREKTDKKQNIDQNEEIISYHSLTKQNNKYEEKKNDKIKSEIKSKTCQEKESKKAEMARINIKQNDVKILLKKNHLSHEEQTFSGNPEFKLQNDNEEFPDLVAACKPGSSSLASDWLSGGTRMPIISYSSVLKAMPKLRTQPYRHSDTLNIKESSAIPDQQDQDGNEGQGKKKKKKKKKKAKNGEANVAQATQEQKITKQPMQFDLGDWVSTIEKNKERNPKKAVTLAGGILQIKVKDKSPSIAHAGVRSSTNKTFHNALDSTAPVVKRGKEREVPKKKKPSQLKKIILKEREEKRKAMEEEGKGDGNIEPKSLGEGTQVFKETNVVSKSEEKLFIEHCDVTTNQTKDEVVSHDIVNPDVTSSYSSSEGDLSVAPSKDDVKAQIHSRRFREYCDNVMDKELDSTTLELLQKLVIFQDRIYHKEPIKFKAKRRFVVGLREVTKHLKLKKIKLVIISPNVERIKSAGGLDDTLYNIINIAHQNGVPVVFALRRQVLGRVLHKKVPVSAIGVFYYDGAQDEYKKLMDLTEKARKVYAQRWKTAYDELMERIQKERAEEKSRDTQEESSEQCNEGSRDEDMDDTESPKDFQEKVKANCLHGNTESELGRNEGKEEWENEPERNKMKEAVNEKRKETEDEILDQSNLSVSESELGRNEGKEEWENEPERNKMKEAVNEKGKETEDEILDQSNLSFSEESEDEKECEADSINNEQIELNERNEIESECNSIKHSVLVETDLAVEEL